MNARSVGLAVFLFVQALAGAAFARERIAVFVVVAEDPELSQNLTEVTIAKLAEARDLELVGMRELDASLDEIPKVRNEGLRVCLETPDCLAEVGIRANAGRAVVGTVRRVGANFDLELELVHTKSSLSEGKTHAEVPADLPRLIEALQQAAVELIRPPDSATKAALLPPTVPFTSQGQATAPQKVDPLRSPPDDRSQKTKWTTYAGFGAAGLAVVAFSAAVITGSMASGPPSGVTRKQAQDDLERKKGYATAANAAFVAGGALSAVAVVSFVWP